MIAVLPPAMKLLVASAVLIALGNAPIGAAQVAPAPAPALTNEGPTGYGFVLAYDFLIGTYTAFKTSGNITTLQQPPYPDAIFYLGCVTVPENGTSSAVVKVHPKLAIGQTIGQIAGAGNALVNASFDAILGAARSYPGDRQLFTATYPSAPQSVGTAQFLKTVVGMTVYGVLPADAGQLYACYVGVSTQALSSSSQ